MDTFCEENSSQGRSIDFVIKEALELMQRDNYVSTSVRYCRRPTSTIRQRKLIPIPLFYGDFALR